MGPSVRPRPRAPPRPGRRQDRRARPSHGDAETLRRPSGVVWQRRFSRGVIRADPRTPCWPKGGEPSTRCNAVRSSIGPGAPSTPSTAKFQTRASGKPTSASSKARPSPEVWRPSMMRWTGLKDVGQHFSENSGTGRCSASAAVVTSPFSSMSLISHSISAISRH